MVRIGIDIRGGDHAPSAVLEGIKKVANQLGQKTQLHLYGLEQDFADLSEDFVFHPCTDAIAMDEHPVRAMQQKPNSTLLRGMQDLASAKIDSFASAGHSGALMVAAMQMLGLYDGLSRPAVVSIFPKLNGGRTVVLDVGINVDAKDEQFLEFARLGKAYAQSVLSLNSPKVALLNTGSEASKGNLQYQRVYKLLQEQEPSFVGNAEARDLFSLEADVLVCDGFTGNMLLKQTESFFSLSRELGLKNEFLELLNYESYGASPILGVKGKVLLAHGASGPEAIKNMILSAESFASANFAEQISTSTTI